MEFDFGFNLVEFQKKIPSLTPRLLSGNQMVLIDDKNCHDGISKTNWLIFSTNYLLFLSQLAFSMNATKKTVFLNNLLASKVAKVNKLLKSTLNVINKLNCSGDIFLSQFVERTFYTFRRCSGRWKVFINFMWFLRKRFLSVLPLFTQSCEPLELPPETFK